MIVPEWMDNISVSTIKPFTRGEEVKTFQRIRHMLSPQSITITVVPFMPAVAVYICKLSVHLQYLIPCRKPKTLRTKIRQNIFSEVDDETVH